METTFVIPAKAPNPAYSLWIPAFAGMTSSIFSFRNRDIHSYDITPPSGSMQGAREDR
jgi:hypothetical protein